MKIALDTRDLAFATTGTRTYLQELLMALRSRQGPDLELVELSGLHGLGQQPGSSFFGKLSQHLYLFIWKQVALPLHCFFARADVLICTDYLLPLLPCGAKKIVVFHDALFFDRPRQYPTLWLHYFRWVYLPAAHRAAAIVTPSFFSRDRLLHHFPKWSHQLKVIYQGPKQWPADLALSTHGVNVQQQLQGSPYFLHVGVFEQRKNLLLLLAAFANFSNRHSAKLLLIGRSNGKRYSDDAANIERFIKEHRLQDRVVLAGYLPDDDLPYFYRQARAYVYPSVYEGFGIPLLEAFVHGLPVAAATGSALQEIAAEAALYFDPYQPPEVERCLEQLHTNEELRKELIEKGHERAKRFHWNELVEDFISLAASV